MLIAVNYHYVRRSFDTPFPGIHGITPEALALQLSRLSDLGEFVSGDQVRQAVLGEAPLPERAILATFDDGLREQYEYALPVLRRLEIPALFFVNTAPIAGGTISSVHKLHLTRSNLAPDHFATLMTTHASRCGIELPVAGTEREAALQYPYDPPASARLKYLLNFRLPRLDREILVDSCFAELFSESERTLSTSLYMDRDQIRNLASWGYLGTHGHEHLPLGLLAPHEAEDAIVTSVTLLESWTGIRPFAMSYPYGSRDACAAWLGPVAESAGLTFGFTMERAGNADLEAPLHLARYDCNDLPGGRTSMLTDENLFQRTPRRRWYRAAEVTE